jgi:alkylation response protein AidB-like acyl-CoA dehydrogenase
MTVQILADTDPIASAKALVPLLRSYSDQIEQDRCLPPPVVDALVDARIFKLLVPRSLGGGEADPLTLMKVVEALSSGDGSAGWCVAVASVCGVVGAFLEEDAAREMFAGDRHACLVGSGVAANTSGERGPNRAVETGDGFEVTGRWSFTSGCRHATWLLGVCPVFDGDTPRLEANSEPEMIVVFFPVSDCEIHDTWHVTGLRGTGSHSFSVDHAWVPRSRSLRPGASVAREPGQLYSFAPGIPFAPGFGLNPNPSVAWANTTRVAFAAVSLGIARGAIDAFVPLAMAKTPHAAREPLCDQPGVQEQLGRAESTLRAARAYLEMTTREIWDAAAQNGTTTLAEQLQLQLAASHAVELATQVVDIIWKLAGTSAIVEGSAFDRRFRDIHTLTQNRAITSHAFGSAGKLLLGREN